MRNPTTAKSIAPPKAKMVANYETRDGRYVEVYYCPSSDAVDDLRKYAVGNGYSFRADSDLTVTITMNGMR